jgi:alkylation response protein AidB-like acyl-CoA dehydrogenase
VINGHKWFASGANGGAFAILIARTDPDADPPQARNSAFLVSCDNPGWQIVRDISTMAGHGNHCEVRLTDCVVAAGSMLGERGGGHKLGQFRLGPARLAHCMRWIGNAEIALELLVKRALARHVIDARGRGNDAPGDGLRAALLGPSQTQHRCGRARRSARKSSPGAHSRHRPPVSNPAIARSRLARLSAVQAS